MSCDSHSLGDIPGENSNIITLQSILVPSTNIDDVDTDELAWGFDSILPVHNAEDELRGLAHVAVTDHAYAIPASLEPREDCPSPLMTSQGVQTPFEHSDDDQTGPPGQDPDAVGTPGAPDDTFTTYSIYVQNNDQTIHNVTEAMLSSLQRQQQELEEEDEDEDPPPPSPPEPEPPKNNTTPAAVTPSNIRRSTRKGVAEQRELVEKSGPKGDDTPELFKKPTETVENTVAAATGVLSATPTATTTTTTTTATANDVQLIKSPELVAAPAAATTAADTEGNSISFLHPSSTSTPIKQSDGGEPETPPSSGRGRGRGRGGRGRGAQKGEPSPVTPGAGRGNAGRGGAKAASRGRGATPTGRGRGRGRGGGSNTPGRKKKVKEATETEEESDSVQNTDQSTTDVSVSEPATETLLAGRPKRRQIKNRKYEKDSDDEPEKPPKPKRAGPGRPPKNKKEDPSTTPKGGVELDTSKESVNSTPLKTKVGRGGKRALAKAAASKLSTTADISDAVSATDVSMNADLSNDGQVSLVSRAADISIEEEEKLQKQIDINKATQELEKSLTIPPFALDKSGEANSSQLDNSLMDTSNSLLESNKQSLAVSKLDDSKLDVSMLDVSKLDNSMLTVSKLGDSKLDVSKLDDSKLDESILDESKLDDSKLDYSMLTVGDSELDSMLTVSKLSDSKLDDSKLDDSKLDDSKLDDSKLGDSKLYDSKLDDSKLDESKLDDSQFEDSLFDDSKLNDSKLDTTSSEDSVLLSSLIIKPKTAVPKKKAAAAPTVKRRVGRPPGVGRGKKAKAAAAVPVIKADGSGVSPDVSATASPQVGKKKKVKVKAKTAVVGAKKKKKKELVVKKKMKKKKKKEEEVEEEVEEEKTEVEPEEGEEVEEEENDGEVVTKKPAPVMKAGRPKRQATIRKEELEKEAKATVIAAAKKKLKKKKTASADSDDEYDSDDEEEDDDDSDDDVEGDVSEEFDDVVEEEEEEDDDEEVPLQRLKKTKGKKAITLEPGTPPPATPPSKKTPKPVVKKVSALQAKVAQVEKELQEEERKRHAADQKARAEAKARAEKKARQMRKIRKSEESLDKTMIDLFKPDGLIVHDPTVLERSRKDSESDMQVDPISQTLSEKSAGQLQMNSSEILTSKPATVCEATSRPTLPSTPSSKTAISVSSPKSSKAVAASEATIKATLPSTPTSKTAINTTGPKTAISTASPKTAINAIGPKTAISIASPKTAISTASPKTAISTASPKTAIVAASPKTAINATGPKTAISTASPKTAITAASTKTPINAASPKTAISAVVPKTAIGAASPKTAINATGPKTAIVAASPKTAINAASPKTAIVAASPKTSIVPGSPKTAIVAGVPKVAVSAAAPKTAISDVAPKVAINAVAPKAAISAAFSVTTPKPVLSKPDDNSGTPAVGLDKTPTTPKTSIPSVPFPKAVPSKTSPPPVVSTTTSSGENLVTTSTTAITTGQTATATSSANDKPPMAVMAVMANSDSSSTLSSPLIVPAEKTVSPLSATKTAAASELLDSPLGTKIPPLSSKERTYSKMVKKVKKTIKGNRQLVRRAAQSTMSNQKLKNVSVAISIGCQADEDSEYEYASCHEDEEDDDDDDDDEPESQSRGGTACSICSMVQDNQYLVICDICKMSFHGHCAELTLEDMQRILQDGEKFVCDNCPLDGGASGAAVSTTDAAQKEEDTLIAAAANATAPVEVPAVHSTGQSSEEASLTPAKTTKEKKQRSDEEVVSSPVKTSTKEVVSNSTPAAATTPKKQPPSSENKKEPLLPTVPCRPSILKKTSMFPDLPIAPATSTPKAPATSTPIPKKPSSEAKPLRKSSKDKESDRGEKGEKDKDKGRLKKSSKVLKRKDSAENRKGSKESKDRKNSKERSDSSSSSHREKKKKASSSSKDKKESLNRVKHRVSSKDKRDLKDKDYTSTPPTTKTFGSMAPRKQEVSSAQVSSSTGQTNESDKKPSEKPKKKKLLHFKDMDLKKRTFQQCIGTGCKSDARAGSVYCSDDCIVQHAQESLALLKNERHWQQTGQKPTEKPAPPKPAPPPPPPPPQPVQQQQVQQQPPQEKQQQQKQPQQTQPQIQPPPPPPPPPQPKKESNSSNSNSKVVVLERKTGRILTGPTAPTESGLKEWLTEHPTFEVLQPSVAVVHKSSSFYGKEKEKQRTVNPERRLSTEHKKKEPPDMKPSSQTVKPDDVRHNVRKSLHEALANRARAGNVKISNTELKQLVFSIEAELYKLYNDSGQKYKARYRSLIFNIKDSNNKGLFRKILSRRIKAYRLVRLTPDEMASAELAQWRQKEAKHTLELIEQREVEALKEAAKGHVVMKKTHKGEVDVAGEDLSTLEVSYKAKPVVIEKPTKMDPKADIIGGIMNDSTESHQTHLFDLNCKICTGKMAPPSDEPPTKKAKKSVASTGQSEKEKEEKSKSHSSSSSSSSSKSEKSEKGSSKSEKGSSKSEKGSSKSEKGSSKSEKGFSKSKSKSEAELLKEAEVKNVIESIRAVTQQVEAQANEIRASPGSPLPSAMKTSSNSRNVTVRSPDSVLQSGLEKKVKFQPSSPLVWKGFIHMQDLVKFMTTAYRMSGPTEHLELQDTIHVCGRIAPELIWDYLTRIKQTGSRDICVLRFLPGSFDEKNAYVTLYSYLNNRGRCGVVGNNSRHIKDMYIVPLASHSKIPPLLLPFDEPGLEDNRPHMLLGVIVRQKVTKRPVEQLSSGSQASVTTDNDTQVKRLKYDPMLPSTTIKIEPSASQLPAKYDPTQPATLPPKYPVAVKAEPAAADTQPTSSATLPELKDSKYYNTPAALKEVPYTPSPVVNVKTERFKQPSPSPVDSSTPDTLDAIGSRINDPIVKAFGKMDALSVNTAPVEDLSAAPYSPTQYDPAPASLLSSHSDSVSTSSSSNSNNNVAPSNKGDDPDDDDYDIQDDEKPYDPEECDFEAGEDSPPPPPPPPPPPGTPAVSIPSGMAIAGPTSPKSACSMAQIFDQIKMSSLSTGVSAVISAVSAQQNKSEVGEKLPKPSTAGLPTALQNLFSQVSKVSLIPSLTPAIPSTTPSVLPLNLPTTQPGTLGSIQLPKSSTVSPSIKLPKSSFTVNTSASSLTTNAKDMIKTAGPASSGLSQSLTIPGVKKDHALSSLMPGSTLPPISETGWSTIAQTLASLAKVQTSNLTTQVAQASSATVATALITKNTSSSTGVAGSAIYNPSLKTTTTSADLKHITLPESHKTIPNIPKKDVSATGTSLADTKKTTTSPTISLGKSTESGKSSSVRIAFSTGPKHPLVPHAAFKEEEKPKLHSLMSEPKIPGLGVEEEDNEEEEEEMHTDVSKDPAFLTRAEFDAMSSIAKTDSFLAGGLRSDSFISNWKGINIGNKDGVLMKFEDSKALYEAAKAGSEQQAALLKGQSESQIESNRSRSDTQYESSSSSSSTKTKPETSSKDLGKGRSEAPRYEPPSPKSKENPHHDSTKSRPSHDPPKDPRRRSDSDRKRSSSGSGHHSDTGSSSKSGRYSERGDRHSHSRHSRGSRDYPEKRDRDHRSKDYGTSEHRGSRDREYDRERDREYDHGSSKGKDRGSEKKEHPRRSSSTKSEDRSGNKKGSDKSDKLMSNEDSNKYGDVDERKKVYGASSSHMDSANRYTADKKDIPMSSSHDGLKSYKSVSVKKEPDDSFRSLPYPNQDQDLRKGHSHNVALPPAPGVAPAPQPIPTLTSSSLEVFPSDVDHRKHGPSWSSENDPNTPSWASRGDIDYRSQGNPGVVGPRNMPPQPTHNTGGAIPGWANTPSAPPQHMTGAQASFQSISTVLNQRPVAGKQHVEAGGNLSDQDMRKLAMAAAAQKIEVVLPRPSAKDFFGVAADSESSDSMSQSPSHFENPELARQRIPGTFIAPSGNPNESQNSLRAVLPNWNNTMPAPSATAAGLTPASILTPRDVDDRHSLYRKVGLPPLPPPAANSSPKVMKLSPADSAHSYSAAGPPLPPPPHGSHLDHIVTSTTVISSTSPQETRPVKSVVPSPLLPAAAAPSSLLPVIIQELPSSGGIPSKKAHPTYGTSNLPASHLPPHSEFVPSTSHIQPVVDLAASERLQTNPQNIPMPDHHLQPPLPPPPRHDPQKQQNISGNPQSHSLVPSWPAQQDSSSSGQAPRQGPLLSPNEYYEHATAPSDSTLSSSPSSSVAGVSMDPHLGSPPPLSSIRPPPIGGGPPPPPLPPFPGSGPQLHQGGQFMGPHPQSGHGYHLPSRTDYHQGEQPQPQPQQPQQGPRTFAGPPRHQFRPPGPSFHGPRMEQRGGGGGGASSHFPHQRQSSRFN